MGKKASGDIATSRQTFWQHWKQLDGGGRVVGGGVGDTNNKGERNRGGGTYVEIDKETTTEVESTKDEAVDEAERTRCRR